MKIPRLKILFLTFCSLLLLTGCDECRQVDCSTTDTPGQLFCIKPINEEGDFYYYNDGIYSSPKAIYQNNGINDTIDMLCEFNNDYSIYFYSEEFTNECYQYHVDSFCLYFSSNHIDTMSNIEYGLFINDELCCDREYIKEIYQNNTKCSIELYHEPNANPQLTLSADIIYIVYWK